MSRARDAALTSRDWLPKASAGLVLGLALAVAISGLFAWFGPGGLYDGAGKTQVNMWLISPVWCGVLSLCFLFRNGRAAWIWLGAATLLAFALLYGGRWLITSGGL